MITPFCAPEVYDQKNFSSLTKGYDSLTRRCFYKKDSYDLIITYARKFWEAYKGQNKLFKLDFMDAHEPSGENVKTIDNSMRNFLDYLANDDDFNFTEIIIHSDHGFFFM
jgi:membrane-anchored protein YejM (alkaline phosphatase superfamily)